MKTKQTKNIAKRLSVWAIVVTGILMIPFLLRFPWTTFDFVFAGVVLFGSATVYEVATRNMSHKFHRVAVAIAVLAFLVLVQAWAAA